MLNGIYSTKNCHRAKWEALRRHLVSMMTVLEIKEQQEARRCEEPMALVCLGKGSLVGGDEKWEAFSSGDRANDGEGIKEALLSAVGPGPLY